MSERAALDLLCSICECFTELCLHMTIACEWRVVMGPETHEECVQNQRTAIWQPTRSYALHAVQPEMHNRHACNLQPDPRSLVGSRDPGPALVAGVQVSCRQPTSYQ
jgi:hypothetical protein